MPAGPNDKSFDGTATISDIAAYRIKREAARQNADPEGVHYCPRCGELLEGSIYAHAVSRRAEITICDSCGVQEALCAAAEAGVINGEADIALEQWAVAKGAYHILAEESEGGYDLKIPEIGVISRCRYLEDIIPTAASMWGCNE